MAYFMDEANELELDLTNDGCVYFLSAEDIKDRFGVCPGAMHIKVNVHDDISVKSMRVVYASIVDDEIKANSSDINLDTMDTTIDVYNDTAHILRLSLCLELTPKDEMSLPKTYETNSIDIPLFDHVIKHEPFI